MDTFAQKLPFQTDRPAPEACSLPERSSTSNPVNPAHRQGSQDRLLSGPAGHEPTDHLNHSPAAGIAHSIFAPGRGISVPNLRSQILSTLLHRRENDEVVPSVLCPGCLVMPFIQRHLLTVAVRLDPFLL